MLRVLIVKGTTTKGQDSCQDNSLTWLCCGCCACVRVCVQHPPTQADLDAAQGRLADATGEIEQLRRQQQEEHDGFEAGLYK